MKRKQKRVVQDLELRAVMGRKMKKMRGTVKSRILLLRI